MIWTCEERDEICNRRNSFQELEIESINCSNDIPHANIVTRRVVSSFGGEEEEEGTLPNCLVEVFIEPDSRCEEPFVL